MPAWQIAVLIAGAYLVGAIPVGYLAGRLVAGVDIRVYGSGNIGATNVGRVLGRRWGLLVWFLDALKGFLPAFAADALSGVAWTKYNVPLLVVVCGLAAVVGHMFPVYLRFRGGKGVSTAFGVFLYVFPAGCAIALVVWGLMLALTRYISVSSMAAACALAVAVVVLAGDKRFTDALPLTSVCFLAAALVIVRHQGNIRRLVAGTEKRVGGGRAMKTVEQFLDEEGVAYRKQRHPTAVTAQEVAQSEHVPGDELAKTVVLKCCDKFWLFVLPATRTVSLSRAGKVLGGVTTLATEAEMEPLFPDAEVGAEPPFGSRYGLATYVDESLSEQKEIVFRAGNHHETIAMSYADYAKLEKPKVAAFSQHV